MTSRRPPKRRAARAKKVAERAKKVETALDAVAIVREALVEERKRLQGKDGAELTPTQRRMLLTSLVSFAERLGSITGETLQIPESKIVRLPAFRRVVAEMGQALAPWPEALAAIAEALTRIERGEGPVERPGT